MTKKSDAPAIRFKGFSDAWEQRKFSDITFPAGEKNRDNLPLESYSITNEHGFVPQDEKFENGGTMREADKRMYYIVSPNSFAYNPARINVGSIGYQNIGKNVIVSSLYEVFKTSEDVDDRLLWHWFKSPDFQKLIMQLQEGGVRLYFYYDKLCMGEVSLPSLEEQRKIGKLFDTLDNLITLHQRKFEKLTNVKKSMLEKMFPQNGSSYPEIRFKGFTDPWEQRKWINTVDISTNMVDPKSGKYDLLPHVAPGNIESFTGRLYDNVKLVGEENLISGKFVFNVGDIVYGKINPQLGKYVFARFSGLTSADAYVLNAKNGIVQKFLYAVIQTRDFYDYSVSVSKRSGMPKINRDELNAYSYWAPSESEQLKIGEYLLTLDHLITLHQRELEKLQNIKKSMLEKMFVYGGTRKWES